MMTVPTSATRKTTTKKIKTCSLQLLSKAIDGIYPLNPYLVFGTTLLIHSGNMFVRLHKKILVHFQTERSAISAAMLEKMLELTQYLPSYSHILVLASTSTDCDVKLRNVVQGLLCVAER